MSKNKRAGKALKAFMKDWAGTYPTSPESKITTEMLKRGGIEGIITSNADNAECEHSMTVVTNMLYLPGEVLIERYCTKCGFKQIRLEWHDDNALHPPKYLTKWITCGDYNSWDCWD